MEPCLRLKSLFYSEVPAVNHYIKLPHDINFKYPSSIDPKVLESNQICFLSHILDQASVWSRTLLDLLTKTLGWILSLSTLEILHL